MSLQPLVPHDYQEEAVQQILDHKQTLVYAGVGSGKAQPLDSLVLTPNGFKNMGDITVGEEVVTPDNSTAKVLAVFPQGMRPVYKITMKDGSTVKADENHLWPITTQKHPNTRIMTTLEAKELLDAGHCSRTPKIALVESLEFGSGWDSTIPPYAIGLLLGNGGLTSSVTYSTADIETVEYLSSVLPEGLSVNSKQGDKYSYAITGGRNGGKPNVWMDELRRLGIYGHGAWNKYVPKQLLNSDKESRLELLRGLLDTDGTPSKSSNKDSKAVAIEFSTASEQLAEDVMWLAKSLGATARKSLKTTNYNDKLYQRVIIHVPNGLRLFNVKRKQAHMGERTKYILNKHIIRSIEYIGEENTQCILIDSEEHEYVTDNFIRTHNTLVGVEAMLRAETAVNLIVAPLNTYRGWQKTLQRQGGKELQFIDARKVGKEAHRQLALGVPGYYFMGTERMRTQAWASWKLDFVIIDEVHKISNRKSKTFKMAKTMKALYRVGLSATPAGNKPEGLYAVGKWHWPKTIPNSFVKWAQEYLYPEYNPFSQFNDWGAEREPGTIMKDFPSVARMPSSYTGKPAIHDIMVELNPTQRKVYKQLEGEAIAFLEDNSLMVVDLPSTLYIRLIETTLATPSVEKVVDEESGEVKDKIYFKPDAKSSKADALLEILSDLPPQPVLVFTHSRKFAEFLTQRLVSKNYSAKAFVGGLPPQERFDLIDNFGVTYDIMVATIPAVGEGTDTLQHKCATECWMSVSDNNVLNTQAKGRLSRQGQEKLVNRYVLRAQGTVEEKQAGRLALDLSILEESLDTK